MKSNRIFKIALQQFQTTSKRFTLLMLLPAVTCFFTTCSETERVHISLNSEDVVVHHAGQELVTYLARLYPDKTFGISKENSDQGRCIFLYLSDTASLENDEAYIIAGSEDRLAIYGRTPRALLNGVYGLLERLGCSFYLSMVSVNPVEKDLEFSEWSFSDAPLVEDRIVFNWHNFLSGCSAWDYPDWKDWIERASRMRYNTIMVHAYGNNPMFKYSFKGKQSKTAALPATKGGRDYGTQQVNDVRRLYGGEVFDQAVFGSEIATLSPEDQPEAVANMMSQVFDEANARGMKICFAFDIDTYPSNPQELINLLPPTARFRIPLEPYPYLGRYNNWMWLADPETPEGYTFYKSKIAALLRLYPQIDQVVLWIRRKGSEWLSLRPDQLPGEWQIEYARLVQAQPQISDWVDAPGRFALGKVAVAFQQALRELGREDVELKAGSWAFDWMEPTDLFFPEEIGFVSLDYNVLHGVSDIDVPEKQKLIAAVSQRRQVTPVFWAHHDDGAYMGRPYVPIVDLPGKLDQVGADGFGIIHWTTWPLDPYFRNMAQQVWQSTHNIEYRLTIDQMAEDLFGQNQKKKLVDYLFAWATTAPMMGRETREWFVDKKFDENTTREVVQGCDNRLNMLREIDEVALGAKGRQFLQYFKGLEEFGKMFYTTEHAYQQSLRFAAQDEMDKALKAIRQCRPESAIDQYAKCSATKGITRGEQGLIISLNLDWLPYIENQRQALGESPVRYNFAPTVHPKFGQGILRTNYFVDQKQDLWRNYGTEETGASTFELGERLQVIVDTLPVYVGEICSTGIESDSAVGLTIRPIVAGLNTTGPNKKLLASEMPAGTYQLQLLFHPSYRAAWKEDVVALSIYHEASQLAVLTDRISFGDPSGNSPSVLMKNYEITVFDEGNIRIELNPLQGKAHICGAILKGNRF